MIRLRHNHVEFWCETVEQAAELAERLSSKWETHTPAKEAESPIVSRKLVRHSIAYLEALESANSQGMTTEQIGEILKLSDSNAVAGRISHINSLCRQLGFDPKQIIRSRKSREHGRLRRIANPDLARALIARLKKEGGAN